MRTIVTNSLGEESNYTHAVIAGQPRLLDILGAVQERSRFLADGRLVTNQIVDVQHLLTQ